MAKCVMVLYPDPVDGYPPKYARDSIPEIHNYPGGATLPTPSKIDFTPGELLGSVSGALGLQGDQPCTVGAEYVDAAAVMADPEPVV